MTLTNKIVANIKKTNVSVINFLNTNNVVCIDTCNNRIGINTKTPRYSIDICGTGPSNMIYANKLQIGNIAIIKDISCQNKIDASNAIINFLKCTTLSGDIVNTVSLTTISASIVDLSINRITLNKIEVRTLDVSTLNVYTGGTLSGNYFIQNLNVRGTFTISGDVPTTYQQIIATQSEATTFRSTNSYINRIDCSNINVDLSGIFNGDISINIMYLNVGTFKTLTGDILNIESVRGGDISCQRIDTYDCSINGTLTVNNIKDGTGNSIIQNGALVVNSDTQSVFGNLQVTTNLSIPSNCDISSLKITSRLDFSNNASLIMPSYSNYSLRVQSSIAATTTPPNINIIKFYNSDNSWSNIYTKNHYASIVLNSTISGNSVNITNNIIENSNNLIIETLTSNNKLYKYIPIDHKLIGNNKAYSGEGIFDISSIHTPPSNKLQGTLKVPDISGIYEINATVSMRYLNKIQGDVEPNTYTFGLYSNIISPLINTYVENLSNILTFDNSFNNSTSSLNYIGPLYTNSDGFIFLISSDKDLDYLLIDRFNGSIKLLNY